MRVRGLVLSCCLALPLFLSACASEEDQFAEALSALREEQVSQQDAAKLYTCLKDKGSEGDIAKVIGFAEQKKEGTLGVGESAQLAKIMIVASSCQLQEALEGLTN